LPVLVGGYVEAHAIPIRVTLYGALDIKDLADRDLSNHRKVETRSGSECRILSRAALVWLIDDLGRCVGERAPVVWGWTAISAVVAAKVAINWFPILY
jgi:hypothetical protein